MDKRALVDQIIAHLDAELALSAQSARAAHAEATDEQSKAENKYDTRGLEASYLARGQSLKAAETLQARQQFAEMRVRVFSAEESIDVGAVITLAEGAEREVYFLAPRAGGLEVSVGQTLVWVITPQSPVGCQLMGRKAGEDVRLELGRLRRVVRILRVE